ncbi:MAG: hypothetical protein O7G83_05285 [Proteobacteria bacterium]|nr:hypothetical protein [Pseudomonadota bacterium]
MGLESGNARDISANRVPKLITHAKDVLDSVAVRRRACELIDVSSSKQIERRGLIAIFSNGSPFVTMTTALPARELRRLGYDVLYLSFTDSLGKSFPASTNWRQFSGIVLGGGRFLVDSTSNGRNFAWTVDWKNRVVEANGINFYQVVFETLCNRFRRFSIDISDPVFSSAFDKTIDIADTILAVCVRLYEINRTQKQPIRILAGAPHLVPAGVFRKFCEIAGYDNNMEFVVFKPSYEHYFSNMTNTRITKLAIENMTRFRDMQRLPVFARRKQFENWLATAGPYKESWEKVRGVLKLKRLVTDQKSAGAEVTLRRIRAAKQEGRPIVCIFGKILYDISEPEQGGPVHRDIKEWINDTISIAGSSDALFLIKPHPSETKLSFGTPTERFTGLVHVDLPENVFILEHRWFNLPDLTPLIDLGVIWAGMTALELGAMGIPCIVCNSWGLRDHPIAFPYPKSREDYKVMLKTPFSIAWPDAERVRCVRLLDYLSHEDFMISYPYAQIPMRGIDKAPKVWNEEELERYLSAGDRHVTKIVARIVGDA